MKEYRRDIAHDPGTKYYWVHMGPIPGYPDWHVQSQPSSYPFPTAQAAGRFADAHSHMWPGREVYVASD